MDIRIYNTEGLSYNLILGNSTTCIIIRRFDYSFVA